MSGSTQLIENSLPAIMRAHEVGASIVEIDVYENKDGTLILSHDTTLKRVAGDPRAVSDLSNDDIAKIRLKDGSHIPTLEEVFVLAKEHNIRLIVEPKLHGKERILYDELIRLFAHYDMYDLAWIQSLSLSSLMEIREREPRIRIGYTIFGGMGNFSAIPVDFYAIQETMMNTRTINKIHSVGKEVYVWTVNNPEYIERYLRMGVDGIITDEAVRIADEVERIRSEEEENPRFVIRIFGYEIPLVSHLADS